MDGLPWLRQGHGATRVVIHMVWSTERRYPWLEEPVDARLEKLIRDKCRERGCRALAVGNADDHVHVLVILAATLSVASLAHRLKGFTSRILAMQLGKEFAWQAGYYAESVTNFGAAIAYVLGQRCHHRLDSRPEPWEIQSSDRREG